ncbi:MAG: 3-methyl-2-oxobutanoate hydroxymethyltransferase [Candidatus Bathyarchaeota archaeon]|nr:MAG: 3-methyl-2-oxobutanoate hydroxymethyltransferase [Candidatus Bathyarchaeota archaeon]
MDVGELRRLKDFRKVTVLTAYDYQTAKILDSAGVDIILVGDSLGMVVLGYEDTKRVTMHDMVRHTEAVARGASSALIVSDMPINSYDSVEDAMVNAGKLVEAGAEAVKPEGNVPGVVEALVETGIPVMGHVGLLPQTAEEYKVKGKKQSEADRIHSDALELDSKGVFSIVLECIPRKLARRITEAVGALTIGIGAGVHCDGQVLVINDMLGMEGSHKPRHVKRYANLEASIREAVDSFIEEVVEGKFPDKEHSFR